MTRTVVLSKYFLTKHAAVFVSPLIKRNLYRISVLKSSLDFKEQ